MLFAENWFNTVSLEENTHALFKLDGRVEGDEDGVKSEANPPKLLIRNADGAYSSYGSWARSNDGYNVRYWVNSNAGVGVFYTGEQAAPGCGIENSVLVVLDKGNFNRMINSIGQYVSGTTYKEFSLVYENEDLQTNESIISNATAASIFGVDGVNDRIFLGSGNTVYFSENDMDYKPNPTYFPVDNFIICGNIGAPISAMMRVSDGTLAIFKDVSIVKDVSVYYTSGYYESVGVGEEGNEYQRAKFTVKAGDIARKGISARAIANLAGDNIFASKEGVYGIQLSDNVASGERYARERSRMINPKLSKLNTQNGKGIVFEDKYFLAVDNGEVYVADARYKFTQKGDQENTFNYEWFRLTGLYVKEWFIFEDELYFIDKDGYVCKFTEDFADQYLLSKINNELAIHETYIDMEFRKVVVFNAARLNLINAAAYAKDAQGDIWSIEIVTYAGKDAILIPKEYENKFSAGGEIDLWFYVPVSSYWRSAVLDLNSPINQKNMWSLTLTAMAQGGGQIDIGYKTRLNYVNDIQSEGANSSTWGDDILFGGSKVSLLTEEESPFGLYSFDVGGYIGVNSYRRRIFERNFMHIQLLFISESVSDCAVSEIDIEYSIARKNIGVG